MRMYQHRGEQQLDRDQQNNRFVILKYTKHTYSNQRNKIKQERIARISCRNKAGEHSAHDQVQREAKNKQRHYGSCFLVFPEFLYQKVTDNKKNKSRPYEYPIGNIKLRK